ncbi:MAG: methyl-accepting chemotaxis protein [Lachnospiraceae bacterium]|nr:methyl-accepting chemotaxis protein [Lachnospiraceae bacterium]
MAGTNLPENCIQKLRDEIVKEKKIILDIAESNTKSIAHLTEDIADIKSKSASIGELIDVLNEVIVKYNAISGDINSIATFINLISLNASIEAGRAGEAGKTFAVVAEEIRKLATQSKKTVSESDALSKQSSESIASIINMINEIIANIDRAHISISIIDQSLTHSLENFNQDE